MAIPDKIKIQYLEDYHTENIGQYALGNQFMAFVVATLPEIIPKDVGRHKRWYAVLHTFDSEGNHLNTEARFAGVTADGEQVVTEKAWAWVAEMLTILEPGIRGDIEVKLFSIQVDGHIFGLVDTSFHSEEGIFYEEVSLLPNDFVFSDPWDGDYDT